MKEKQNKNGLINPWKLFFIVSMIPLLPIVLLAFALLFVGSDYRQNPRATNSKQWKKYYGDDWGIESQPKKIEKTEFDKILEKYTTNPNSK